MKPAICMTLARLGLNQTLVETGPSSTFYMQVPYIEEFQRLMGPGPITGQKR